MADNKRRGRFGKGSQDDANQSIFDLFEPPPDQDDTTSFGKIPVIRDEESLDLTDAAFVESQASAQAEAAGLAHWTEPPTGQIPASLGSDRADGDVKGPSWQGEDPNWEGADLADVFADTAAITHDRIIELDDDEILAEAPPAPRPNRPAPARRPEAAGRVPPGPSRGKATAPSVFDTPPGSGPAAAGGAPPAPTQRRQATPTPAARPPAAASPPAPTGPRMEKAPPHPNAEAPPPARQATPPAVTGRTDRPPQPPAPRAAAVPPSRQRPPAAPPPPPVAGAGATDEQLFGVSASSPRRGAHDLRPDPVTPPDNVELLGVDRGDPAPTGQVAKMPTRMPAPSNGTHADDYDIDEFEAARGMHPEPVDDYDEYDDGYDYDDYDDEGGGRSLGQSVLVGAAIAAVVFVTLGFGPVPTMVLICVLTFVAVMELFNAMRLAGLRPATLLGLVGAVALPAATYVRGDAGFPLVIGLAVVFGMLWYLTGADTERPVLNLGLTFTGILWIGGLAAFGALMVRAEDGVGLLLATIIMAAASDTLAYIGGRAYGTKAFHSASPNKTWEGTITGFFGALFAGLAIGVTNLIDVFDGQFVSVMVLAAVVGLLAPIGDLAESLVKRDLGVKDMGTLLPGHGGILDRVDGLLFALPGAYYVAVVYSLI